MTITNVVLEIPMEDLATIARELTKAAAELKTCVTISQEDCIKTHLHRSGIYSWIAQHTQGEYSICCMTQYGLQYYDMPIPVAQKPWYMKNGTGFQFNNILQESVPILFRFTEESDAILFKMTYVDKN